MNKQLCRGIKNLKTWQSLVNGKLKEMLEVVKQDEELVLHLRNNYINIYYRSGNVAKINSENSVTIDENYFISKEEEDYCRDKSKRTAADEIRRKALIAKRKDRTKLFKDGEYKEYFKRMKETMKNYWHYQNMLGEDEGDVQQKLCSSNKYNSEESEYTIIDLEHEVSIKADFSYKGTTPFPIKDGKKKENPRFDIVAVRKSDGQLFVMELKKGNKTLEGPSGMHDHVDSFLHTIKEKAEAEKSFVEEMEYVLMQKQILGLVDKAVKITSEDVQFAFVYSFGSDDRDGQKKEKEHVENLRKSIVKGIDISQYQIIYLQPKEYTLK